MENLIKSLSSLPKSHGHFTISFILEGETYSTVTTNTLAIDAAFDDCYDDEDRSDSFYESRLEAQQALIHEITNKNGIEI